MRVRAAMSLRFSPGLLLACFALGCGAPTITDNGVSASPTDSATPTASATPSPTATPSGSSDGTPTRDQCTSSFGTGLSSSHGRLDGILVAIVPPSSNHTCSADSDHVHLQISVNGAIHDVAVNVHDNNGGNVYFHEADLSLPDGAWSEGFHSGDSLDYVQLGMHSGDFTSLSESALSQKISDELATANHVSVFATPYNSSGVHLVHRVGNGDDGAIVIRPLSGTPHLLFFHFANQSF